MKPKIFTHRINVRLTEEQFKTLEIISNENGVSIVDLIRQAINSKYKMKEADE